MPQSFYIFSAQPELDNAASDWCWHDGEGNHFGQGNDAELIHALDSLSDNTSVYLLLPTEELFLGSVDIPAKQAQQIQQAAPFAIEEFVAIDPARLQVATRRNPSSGQVDVIAIEREQLRQILTRVQNLGIYPQAVYADIFSLPSASDNTLVIKQTSAQRLLMRWGSQQGCALNPALLADFLPILLREQADSGTPIDCIQVNPGHSLDLERILSNHSDIRVEQIKYDFSEKSLGAAINLLTGEFHPGHHRASQQDWKKPLQLSVVVVLLLLLSAFLSHQRSIKHLKALDTAIEKSFREAFPEVQRIEDPLIQARQKLAGMGPANTSNSGLIKSLADYAAASANSQDIQLAGLEYQRNKLELKLHANNIAQLEALRDKLNQQGVPSQLSSASLGKGGVDARLILDGESSR